MKVFVLLICPFFLTSLSKGQIWNSSCTPTGNMQAIYRNDAHKMAFIRVNQLNLHWKDSVLMPDSFRDTFSKALFAIHNMEWSPLKDTVMNLFGFSDFSATNFIEADSLHFHSLGYTIPNLETIFLKQILIKVAANSFLANEWSIGNYYNTSNTSINQLLSKYHLIVTPSYLPNFYNIKSPVALNPTALVSKFSTIVNVEAAEDVNFAGDGNFIKPTLEQDGIRLEYGNGCGDCPAGCTYHTKWTFKVFNNCQVQYIGRIPIADGETAFQRVCSRGVVVPVTFTSITALLNKKLPIIHWTAVNESNIRQYIVERSSNGVSFYAVGKVNAEKIAQLNNYIWKDLSPIQLQNFYRIKAIRNNGAIDYSSVVNVTIPSIDNMLMIYPNPTTSSVHLAFSNINNESLKVEIADALGMVVLRNKWFASSNQITLSTAKFSAGTYIVKVLVGNKFYTGKLVISK